MTFIKQVDGTGEEMLLEGVGIPSPDGKHILVRENETNRLSTRWHYVETSGTNSRPFRIQEVFGEISKDPVFGPDGRWLAFAATALGQQNEIWAVDFPQMNQRTMVSRGGGHYPRWNANGRELFFLSHDRKTMMSAQRKPDDSGFEEPRKLFDLPETIYAGHRFLPSIYDVTADGERFLMLQKTGDSSSTNRTARPNVLLVENWFEEFRGKK